MSRDSSRTYIHLPSVRHADLFEDFNHPQHTAGASNDALTSHNAAPLSTYQVPAFGLSSGQPNPTASTAANALPHEDIYVPPHHMPPNPEDEDDVVPDQHAAFGITRALGGQGDGQRKERRWQDFERLAGLVRGDNLKEQDKAGAPRESQLPLRGPR